MQCNEKQKEQVGEGETSRTLEERFQDAQAEAQLSPLQDIENCGDDCETTKGVVSSETPALTG